VRRLLYGSFSKKDARNLTLLRTSRWLTSSKSLSAIWQLQQKRRSQSDTVSQSLAHVVEAVVCYMAASAKKTLARNLTMLLQSLAHVEGIVCYMAASAKKTLAI
jgi:hypothetical protein